MTYEVNLAAWRLGVMLSLLTLTLPLTLTLKSVSAQYPTMIPVTDELLTARPTTEAKRVQEESMNDEGGSMKEEGLCDLCSSVVGMETERGDGENVCDLCDSVVDETETGEEEESGRSGEWLVGSEEEESEEVRWIVLFRSICVGIVFVGSLVGMVVVLWRRAR